MSVARKLEGKTLNLSRSKLGLYIPTDPANPGMVDLWPRCMICQRPVEAYGKVDEGDRYSVYEARCRHDSVIRTKDDWKNTHFDYRKLSWMEQWEPTQQEIDNQVSKLKFFEKDHHDA